MVLESGATWRTTAQYLSELGSTRIVTCVQTVFKVMHLYNFVCRSVK